MTDTHVSRLKRIPAQPMEPTHLTQGHRQTQGVRQLVCQGEALLAPLQRLIWIA